MTSPRMALCRSVPVKQEKHGNFCWQHNQKAQPHLHSLHESCEWYILWEAALNVLKARLQEWLFPSGPTDKTQQLMSTSISFDRTDFCALKAGWCFCDAVCTSYGSSLVKLASSSGWLLWELLPATWYYLTPPLSPTDNTSMWIPL